MVNSYIKFNEVLEEHGGGLFIRANSSVFISQSKIYKNFAYQSGGGIYASKIHKLDILNSKIKDNTCQHFGESIFAENTNEIQINNNLFDNQHNDFKKINVSMEGGFISIL